jgi:hypothetical protein
MYKAQDCKCKCKKKYQIFTYYSVINMWVGPFYKVMLSFGKVKHKKI